MKNPVFYYFFVTSEELRDGEMKPTLRALPGQHFEDGTPIDETLNVMAPKDASTYNGGSRLQYPYGTVFCSTYVKLMTKTKAPYLSVYPDGDLTIKPNFHPVSDDPAFHFISAEHCDQKMNAAYTLFKNGLPLNNESNETEEKDVTTVYSPTDENGLARGEITGWKENYPHQLEEEIELFILWIKELVKVKHNINLPTRIHKSSIEDIFSELYHCGESLDSIISTARFEQCLKDEKISYETFAEYLKGPHYFYLGYLLAEHVNRKPSTALKRNFEDKTDVEDASFILCKQHNGYHDGCESHNAKETLEDVKNAIKAGWTISEMLVPDNINKKGKYTDYVKALSSGEIPLPDKLKGEEASYIDILMTDKKYKTPTAKKGFHVDPRSWKLLVYNLSRRINTCLCGPTGCGKTELVRLLAERAGMNITIIQMGTIHDPVEQLGGVRDIDTAGSGISFILSDFAQAIQKPGIVLLDELNRIPKNGTNMIFNCLDGIRELSISGGKTEEQKHIKVHPDCVFFATANIGEDYVGTNPLDPALAGRFMFHKLNFQPIATERDILVARTQVDEKNALNIATVANQLREKKKTHEVETIISMRETLRCAQMVKDGYSCPDAMEYCFLDLMSEGDGPNDQSSERSIARKIIASRFANVR